LSETQTTSLSPLLEAVRGSRRYMALGLGALWLADGALQLQPAMFTQSFAVNVIGPAIQGLPNPLYAYALTLLEKYVMPHIALWNVFFAALQLAIGALILVGGGLKLRIGLYLSLAWSVVLWVFGEGLGGIYTATMGGGIFPGTPSLISGFPGAALLYAWVSILLLLPEHAWRLEGLFSPVRDGAAVLFAVSAAIQLAPLLRTPFGQASIFTANLDNLPPKLWFTVMPVAHFAVSHPAAADELEALATGLAALATWGARPKKWGYIYALTYLGFIWWFGLGLGGLLTGLGTDPNTPPLIALLMTPYIYLCRHKPPVDGPQ